MKNPIYILIFAMLALGSAHAQVPQVVSTSPGQNDLNVASNTLISVEFDVDMDPSSITTSSWLVYGDLSGWYEGTIAYDAASKTATFDPATVAIAGERVVAVLRSDIRSASAVSINQPYT